MLVLVTLLSLTGVVLAVMDRSHEGATRLGQLAQERQDAFTSEVGLSLALDILRRDAVKDADTLQEPWAQTFSTRDMTIVITPCNSRMSLANLADGTGRQEGQQRRILALQDILARRGVPPGMVQYLLDWVDEDNQKERAEGAEEGLYARNGLPYRPRNSGLVRPEEISLVPGFEGFSPGLARRLFNTWGTDQLERDMININFVTEATLATFLPELAPKFKEIDAYRRDRGFTNVTQILSVAGMGSAELAHYDQFLTVKSNYFEILVEQRSPAERSLMRCVVERRSPTEKARVVSRDILWIRPLNLEQAGHTPSEDEIGAARADFPAKELGERAGSMSDGSSRFGGSSFGPSGGDAKGSSFGSSSAGGGGSLSTFGSSSSGNGGSSSTFGSSSSGWGNSSSTFGPSSGATRR